MKERYLILQINGPDKEGVFTKICDKLAELQINILDVNQSVLQGHLSLSFFLDITYAQLNRDRVELELKRITRSDQLHATFFDYIEGRRPQIKNLYVLTLLGIDRPGILANISKILTRHRVNIETIKTQVRNGYIFNQLIIDCTNTEDINILRNELRQTCQEFGLSLVLEKEKVYRKNKKLIVFDMDSTLIVGESIVEIAKRVNKENEMNQATEYAMTSDIDFESSLRERARMLEGISEETLREIAQNLKTSQGIEELIHHLKGMGFRIALISSGFSLFTDQMKDNLDLDYSFGNTLEVVDGIATGKIIGEIIDGTGKWQIVKEIAQDLNISMDEVVTVGDGSNDREMLQNSGLGIGFNSKEIASEVADGRIVDQDAYLIMLMLGLSDTEIDEIINQRL